MPLQFDNRVSWMDIVAITGALITAGAVFFGVSSDVEHNRLQIAHAQNDLRALEIKTEKGDDRVLRQLGELKQDTKEIRRESIDGRKEILLKLDKLIDRELDHRDLNGR